MANGYHLAYEEFGKPSDPVILLIMGLGTQMIAWPEAMCQGLASQGYRVIRFDNRDIGLSQKVKVKKPVNVISMFLKLRLGLTFSAPYTLEDLADDAIGILDTLDIEKAHLVGASMGGMIAQLAAIHHSERVLSLTSIMSTTGNPKLPQPGLNVTRLLLKKPADSSDEAYLKQALEKWAVIGSPDYPPSRTDLSERIMNAYRRSYYPAGYRNQLAAIAKNGDRSEQLKSIATPTLVIHGKSDVLVPVEGGIDTAACITGSTLKLIAGMGHDLPREIVPRIVRMIVQHADSVSKHTIDNGGIGSPIKKTA